MEEIINKVNLLAENLVKRCIENSLKIVFAESMTGGLLSSLVTSVPDASKVINESFIVYSDEAKVNILNCHRDTIKQYSVYSEQVISELLDGLCTVSKADIKVAISGIAGPKTYYGIEVGTVYIGIDMHSKRLIFKECFNGDRLEIRYRTSEFVFNTIINNM